MSGARREVDRRHPFTLSFLLLRTANAKGLVTRKEIEEDHGFDSLRSRADFQNLIREITPAPKK